MKLLSAALTVLFLAGAFGSGCKKQESTLIIVHVLRDPSRVLTDLETATSKFEFEIEKPRVTSGEGIMIATFEGPFHDMLRQVDKMEPEVIILTPASDLPDLDVMVKEKLGRGTSVCQDKVAYVPSWVTGGTREAANLYVQFLAKNCGVADQKEKH